MLIGVKHRLSRTSTGMTNKMICRLEPRAISTAAFILFLIAMMTAEECSAALPMIGTRMMPTKASDRPTLSAIGSIVATKISERTAMQIVEPTSMPMAGGSFIDGLTSSSVVSVSS